MSANFLLGLPYLRGPLLATAQEIGADVLVSANAFSAWRTDASDLRTWVGFKPPALDRMRGLQVHLDSAGYVAMAKYRGFPWSVDDYLDLCAARPWTWFASMDLCVEPEIAADEGAVLDRISGTVRLAIQCISGAAERGIQGRLVPVIQGWEAHHYLRCLDRLGGFLAPFPLLGVGSMCRRHVGGTRGIVQIVDALDRALPAQVRLHLFGLKSTGLDAVRGHPRIASVDSQAYGVRARQRALDTGCSKTEELVANVMRHWYRAQIAGPDRHATSTVTPLLPLPSPVPASAIEQRMQAEMENLRSLHEAGEIEWNDVNLRMAYEAMGEDQP